MSGPRVLLLLKEFSRWSSARSCAYTSQLGLTEGLDAAGIRPRVVVAPFLERAEELFAGQRFDQVWLEVVHNQLDPRLLEWVRGLAPVRVGLAQESLEYDAEEVAAWAALVGDQARPRGLRRYLSSLTSTDRPWSAGELRERRGRTLARIDALTHVVTCDERDAEDLNAREGGPPAFWWPQAVPRRFVRAEPAPPRHDRAVFAGVPYGPRAALLAHPRVRALAVHLSGIEDGTPYPHLFNALQLGSWLHTRGRLPGARALRSFHQEALAGIRVRCFERWLDALGSGVAVLDLPHIVKAYPGRVVEGIAAGRPVVAWDVPARPRNRALFEDGQEILLYSGDDPEALAEQIERVRSDPVFARKTAARARKKLLAHHTMETRIRQVLAWIETGDAPSFGSGS